MYAPTVGGGFVAQGMTPRDAMRRFDEPRFHTRTIKGTGERQAQLHIPYRGEALCGDSLRRQIDAWAEAGIMEPSAAAALHYVSEREDWLDLRDLHFVVFGAAAEIGPVEVLSRLGANIAAVDLDCT